MNFQTVVITVLTTLSLPDLVHRWRNKRSNERRRNSLQQCASLLKLRATEWRPLHRASVHRWEITRCFFITSVSLEACGSVGLNSNLFLLVKCFSSHNFEVMLLTSKANLGHINNTYWNSYIPTDSRSSTSRSREDQAHWRSWSIQCGGCGQGRGREHEAKSTGLQAVWWSSHHVYGLGELASGRLTSKAFSKELRVVLRCPNSLSNAPRGWNDGVAESFCGPSTQHLTGSNQFWDPPEI